MNVLARIKRAVLAGRYAFSDKSRVEMKIDDYGTGCRGVHPQRRSNLQKSSFHQRTSPLTPGVSVCHSESESRRIGDLYQRQVCPRSRRGDVLFSNFIQKSLIIINMFMIKSCPSCGSNKIKKVRCDWRDEYGATTYVVPDLEYFECPVCGERVYGSDAMRKIEAYSPAFQRAQPKKRRLA